MKTFGILCFRCSIGNVQETTVATLKLSFALLTKCEKKFSENNTTFRYVVTGHSYEKKDSLKINFICTTTIRFQRHL